MLWGIIVVLFVLWLIALVAKFTLGGLIHVLLLVAVVMFIWNLVAGSSG